MSTPNSSLPTLFQSTHPPPTLLAQGAEALLYRTHFLFPSQPSVLKYRPPKPYRHPTLDKRLTRHRILSEARTLVKCRREGVAVPGVLGLDADGAITEARGPIGGGAVQNESNRASQPGGKDVENTREGGGQERVGEIAGVDGRGGWMMMEYIPGKTVRENLQLRRRRLKEQGNATVAGGDQEDVVDLMRRIGRAVGRLHQVGVIHGDLTTSNMILRPPSPPSPIPTEPSENRSIDDYKHPHLPIPAPSIAGPPAGEDAALDGTIILIDFGLSTQSLQDEDKAVDLFVLERAFASTHPELEEGFGKVLKAYGESYKGAKVALKRLEEVRLRGRKRSMLG